MRSRRAPAPSPRIARRASTADTVTRTSMIDGGGVAGFIDTSVQNLGPVAKKMAIVLGIKGWSLLGCCRS